MRRKLHPSAGPALVMLFSILFALSGLSPAAAWVSGPGALAISPDGQRLYVADGAHFAVAVVDTATNQLITAIPLVDGPLPPVSAVSPNASGLLIAGLAVSPDGAQLYVTSGHTLSVISTPTNSVVAAVKVGKLPTTIAVSPDGQRVYVRDNFGSTLSVIDPHADQVIATIRVEAQGTSLFINPDGVYPTGLVISPDGKKLYVANRGYKANSRPPALNNTVSVIDAASERVEQTVDVHGAPWALAVSPDGRRIYVTHDDPSNSQVDTLVVEAGQLRLRSTGTLGGFSPAVAVSPDSQRLYLLPSPWDVAVALYPIDSYVLGTAAVGKHPVGLALSPDGRRLYVSNSVSRSVSVIDTAAFRLSATIDLSSPGGGRN
jgi:YVTN family beta-propeller protein